MKSQFEGRNDHLYDQSAEVIFKPPKIDTSQLQVCRSPLASHNMARVKRMYSGVIEVECKPIWLSEKAKVQANLAMIGKLGISPYILKFHGLSKIERKDVQVLEWVELGSLRDFYKRCDIGWEAKVILARDICRGIVFLNSMDVFHHNIRCENILLTSRLEPKIANFDLVREINHYHPWEMREMKVLRWMAPEEMEGKRYDTKNEIFSFGMTLWELAFEKYPYINKFDVLHLEELKKYVTKGCREKITFGKAKDQNEKEIQQRLKEIIESSMYIYIYLNRFCIYILIEYSE
ncbi:kinase-like domain-containing protein [Gigaspora rosea]|uniref:Kinase-like domain-containing protein n=1 Tax=Gigaspora rosea TaxID=44941 RepID=A0A397ULM8_9GLOM|nr:kinase-like domain-containing protein [Gigaspora rosea]